MDVNEYEKYDEQEMVECHPNGTENGDDAAAQVIGQRRINAYRE